MIQGHYVLPLLFYIFRTPSATCSEVPDLKVVVQNFVFLSGRVKRKYLLNRFSQLRSIPYSPPPPKNGKLWSANGTHYLRAGECMARMGGHDVATTQRCYVYSLLCHCVHAADSAI